MQMDALDKSRMQDKKYFCNLLKFKRFTFPKQTSGF